MHTWTAPTVPSLSPDVHDGILRLWDSSSQEYRSHRPEKMASLYVCGITPYDATHLGHAFTYLAFDLVQRTWMDLGYQVRYVQNITDVDDPLLERAEQTGVDWRQLACEQIDLFRNDMEALRVIPPDHWVAVTEAIEPIVGDIERLVDTGWVYQIDDTYADWYFRNSRQNSFGDIAHLSFDQQLRQFAEKGGDPDREGKEDRLDALIWRQERPQEPSWESSLGRGRPGWHIECTTIAQHYLGTHIDIQGGGSDLLFPHHEMCAALGKALTGEEFANIYMNVGMVALDGQKMSKSLGNLELVSRLRAAGHRPQAIRLALISHHYRSDWEWEAQMVFNADQRLRRWASALDRGGAGAEDVIVKIRSAMRDDLNTPRAIEAMDIWADNVHSSAKRVDYKKECAELRRALDSLLGIVVN